MASVGVIPTSSLRDPGNHAIDKLGEEMNEMKIRDDKVCICTCVGFETIFSVLPCNIFPADLLLCFFRRWKPRLLMVMGLRQDT